MGGDGDFGGGDAGADADGGGQYQDGDGVSSQNEWIVDLTQSSNVRRKSRKEPAWLQMLKKSFFAVFIAAWGILVAIFVVTILYHLFKPTVLSIKGWLGLG